MESLGKILKITREKKGLSLKDISLETKIGLRHLEAIENDRLEFLPGGFFTRQILKTYLISIGEDPANWLPKYQEAELIEPETPVRTASKPHKPHRKFRLDKVFWISISVLVLILFVVLIYLSISTSKKNIEARKAPQKIEETSSVTPAETLSPPLAVTETTQPAVQEKTYDDLNLDLIFNEDCWIQVYADGQLVVDGLKLEGYKTSVKASSELTINLGNAGGLSFTINGKAGKPLGKRGEVIKNIKITLDNLNYFLQPEKNPE
ncbi:MAG TPA: DUF4115 domain-containing protein [Candidatus Saccharicenans sp.]|jgi:cytoskeletal protein RodZ|nr:DUF4115 domain-containing protein [Candidatus Saccharicenans sp.]HRD02079.1 DUF4115 domain-containing protein [Candidatus Saccharicenans sp.]